MMKRKTFFILIFVFILAVHAKVLFADSPSAQFLLVPQDARAEALGRTLVSNCFDMSAVYWNPSGLGFFDRVGVSLSNIEYPTEISNNYLAVAVPFRKFCVGLDYISYKTEAKFYDDNGDPINSGNSASAETNNNYRLAIARRFFRNFGIGYSIGYTDMNLFYDSDNIGGNPAQALTHSIGMLYRSKRLALGFSLYNFIQESLKFDADDSEEIPKIMRFGVSYYFLKQKNLLVLMSYDDVINDKNVKNIGVGAEYNFLHNFFMRAGYRLEEHGVNSLTCGIGFLYKSFTFDYAFTPSMQNLEGFSFHRISLSYKFTLKKRENIETSPPKIVIQYFKYNEKTLEPKNQKIYADNIGVIGTAISDKNAQLDRLEIFVNGKSVFKKKAIFKESYDINANINLTPGKNYLNIIAYDTNGEKSEKNTIILTYEKDISKGNATIDDFISNYITSKQNKWAVLVGVEDYPKDSGFERLEYVANDVSSLKKCLTKDVKAFPEENIFTLGAKTVDPYDNSTYVGKATKYNIEKFLGDDLPKKVKPNDSVFIFFSGHGITIDVNDGNIKRKQGFLVPIDGQKDSLFATCVSMDVLSQLSELIPAKQILFVIDSCNSGIALSRNKGDNKKDTLDKLIESFMGRSRQAITAGKSSQISKISTKYEQSIYTYYLVKGLEGAADSNDDTIISIHELHDFLRRNVSKDTDNEQIPQMGGLKNNGEGDFFFIRK